MARNAGTNRRGGVGVVRVADDAIVVDATCAGSRVSWRARRLAGVFGSEFRGAGDPPVRGATLAVPVCRLWRRDIELTGQSADELRDAVSANLSAFFPVAAGTRLLWDVVELRRTGNEAGRASVLAMRAEDVESDVARLAEAGVEVTRVVPSAECFSVLMAEAGEGAELLEVTDAGAMRHRFAGLGWAGSVKAERADEASRVCDWSVSVPEGGGGPGGVWGAEHVALGAALIGVRFGGIDRERHPAPSCDLLHRRAGRKRVAPRWLRVAAVAAMLVAGLSLLASSWRDREFAERDALAAAMEEAKPRADEVDRMRSTTLGIVASHDRLRRFEDGYVERWRVLAAITEALPDSSWAERVELLDESVTIDVAATSVADVVRSIEAHPGFEQARQVGAETLGGAQGTAKARIDARLTRAHFVSPVDGAQGTPAALAAREGGGS